MKVISYFFSLTEKRVYRRMIFWLRDLFVLSLILQLGGIIGWISYYMIRTINLVVCLDLLIRWDRTVMLHLVDIFFNDLYNPLNPLLILNKLLIVSSGKI